MAVWAGWRVYRRSDAAHECTEERSPKRPRPRRAESLVSLPQIQREVTPDMSFKSFLTAVGQDFKKGLDYTLRLEPAIEAGLQIADPPVAALLHVTTATILSVEQ